MESLQNGSANGTANGNHSTTETTGKIITCKAAVVWGPEEPFVLEEVLVQPPQKMEVRIKILFTSICHTDLSAWKGEDESQRAYPRILGHEASGIVESVGEGVRDMKEGDQVVPIFNGECGECSCCKSHKTNFCCNNGVNPFKKVMLNDGKSRFSSSKDGQPIFHFLNTSTFSEYTVLDSACVVNISAAAATLSLKNMSLLSCGVSTGVGAAWNTANVQPGSTVAVFGLGAVGLAVAEGARARGASKIIGVDINPSKFIKVRKQFDKRHRSSKGKMENSQNGSANGNHSTTETTGKVITCKAAVVWGPEQPFVLEEVRVQPPQKMEVRIKILFTSICHTDLSAWKGEDESQRAYPRILGHEASGIVESVGEGVRDMKEGDQVVPIFNGECGECSCCKSHKTNICCNNGVNPLKKVMLNDGKSRFSSSKDGQPIFHFLNTSTFSEYTVLDSACVVNISGAAAAATLSLKNMALLSCGVSTGVGAAWNIANVQPGSTVAVFGLGAVGLAVAEGARARGASKIIGVDINPSKFIKGQTMGVTHFINPRDLEKPVHERIREISEGGVDYSFDCAGNLDILREAFLCTHEGWGLTVTLGVHPTPRTLPIHPMELFNGRSIVGSVFGGFKGKTQLPLFAKQCMSGVVGLDKFITHELPFDKINDAMQLLIEGKSLRCILHI